MAILYRPGEAPAIVTAASKSYFTLEELKRLVGGTITAAPIPLRAHVLIVHDEGALLHLPHNEEASELAETPIFGPAVLLSPKEWE